MRYDLPTILCLAVTGILARRSILLALCRHTTDLEPDDLRSLGLEEGRAPGRLGVVEVLNPWKG